MKDLFIIHYYPIENYPPVLNLINILSERVKIIVCTTGNVKNSYIYKRSGVIIKRPCAMRSNVASLRYLYYLIVTLFQLVWRMPRNVMYYEPISVLPAYIYKRYINNKSRIYIHYHEYYPESDYMRPGTRMWAINHRLERNWLYQNAEWVSQTNHRRLKMFLDNNTMVMKNIAHIFPNFPPKEWHVCCKSHRDRITRCVYVGSLSLKDTFVKEFCEWVCTKKGEVTFDIYSYNFHEETLDAINALNSPYIMFHKNGIPYSEIPKVLEHYDVGLLLYKANTINFQWNETNKFYEYLICGLDVWYPKEMLLLHEMEKSKFAPKIIEVDFKNIKIELAQSKEVDNTTYSCFADEIYQDFYKHICQ